MNVSRQSVELLMTAMEEGWTALRCCLDGLNDGDLLERRLTNWGEYWPTWRIFWTMAAHDLQHGGEMGCLRDLYRWRHQTRGGR